ncbi:MAG: tRNA (N6-isopentenyl adenosine(37)-C2)-methylthiotransferase MiaB [Coxiellaceae bacterium]|jgi:tRNA-2-methylthio-N6-dimethylallyladenosine synthase|nr:tRNA (N6-isopentenyl adenosine(37)-C2)-methylthiotransferase MiaB [Coxiellaceae bacterium]
MQKKFFIKSFGCQMNEYDATKMIAVLVSHDFIEVKDPFIADLIILNACAVRVKAVEKIFSELGKLKILKEKNRSLVLAVGGCISKEDRDRLLRLAPYVGIIFNPQTLHRLPELYQRSFSQKKPIIETLSSSLEKFDYLIPIAPTKTGLVAYISIMEGCNKFCSYCIVPHTRGREISRKLSDILLEIDSLVRQGMKEIHLLGQNVNAYYDQERNLGFIELIHEIAKIESITRIRFTTSHPNHFNDSLIALFKQEPKLTNHVHLPVQSGSNRILQLMRRCYTREEYQEIVVKLRNVRPDISISTDFIVGFPSETDEDFDLTMDFIQKINFDASFSFIYSPRPNTPAAKMKDHLTLEKKKERLTILQNQLMIQSRRYNKNMIGTIQRVFVTDMSKEFPYQFSGRADNNRVVNFNSSKNVLGRIVATNIIGALSNSLRGEIYKIL